MKKKIGRENIINIRRDVERIKHILFDIVNYAEGYKNPFDDLIYSKRELQTLNELAETKRKLEKSVKEVEWIRTLYKRDLKRFKIGYEKRGKEAGK